MASTGRIARTSVRAHAGRMRWRSTRRGRIVLFGGLAIFGAQGDTKLPPRLFGDTWEHLEEPSASPPAASGQGPPELAALTLQPADARPGDPVVATVQLTAPAGSAIPVQLLWLLQSDYDTDIATNQSTGVHLLSGVTIAAGTDPPPSLSMHQMQMNRL
jgi:hypothetical protein